MPTPPLRGRVSTRPQVNPSAGTNATSRAGRAAAAKSSSKTVAAQLEVRPSAADTFDATVRALHGAHLAKPDALTRLVVVGTDRRHAQAAAQMLAEQSARPLHRLDLGSVVSPSIKATERSLAEFFARAESVGAIIYIDEADGLFGQRTQVRDSPDRQHSPAFLARVQKAVEGYPGAVVIGSPFHPPTPPSGSQFTTVIDAAREPSLVKALRPPLARDLNLVRAILIAAEKASPASFPPEFYQEYPRERVEYHLALMMEAGLLRGTVYRSGGESGSVTTVERLTWQGHDAIALMSDSGRWQAAQRDLIDFAGRGDFTELLEWLRNHARSA